MIMFVFVVDNVHRFELKSVQMDLLQVRVFLNKKRYITTCDAL